MALNIKNADVEALATRLVDAKGTSRTEAVREALEAHLEAIVSHPRRSKGRRIREFLAHDVWPFVPPGSLGVPVTRDERERVLGYGDEGV